MKKTNKGFTLVELIIVIAVIGVLAAILIPVFSNVVNKANQKSAMSDARNAVTEFTAAVTDGAGTTMPESVIFAQKGNKVYGFTYTQEGSVEAIDEQGKEITTDFETTVAAYEQELVADNVIKARAESERVDMFNAAKAGGINTGYRNYMALDDDSAILVAERSMINDLGLNNMVITLSYVPYVTLTQNQAAVYDETYSDCFSINGVARPEFSTLSEAIAAAPAGSTVRLYKDATASSAIMLNKNLTIDGNGHELKFTGNTNRGIRLNNANGTEVELTLKNLTIIGGSSFERAVQIDSGANAENRKYGKITIENCNITATKYTCNFCNFTTVDLTIRDSFIQGWAAINAYGIGNKIRVYNSVLLGLNDKSLHSSNAFSTICCEGDYRVEVEPGASADYDILIEDSVIEAKQTTGNRQAIFGFNSNSRNCKVVLRNCDLKSNFFYDEGFSEVMYNWGTYNSHDIENCSFNGVKQEDCTVTEYYFYPTVEGYETYGYLMYN